MPTFGDRSSLTSLDSVRYRNRVAIVERTYSGEAIRIIGFIIDCCGAACGYRNTKQNQQTRTNRNQSEAKAIVELPPDPLYLSLKKRDLRSVLLGGRS